MMRKILSAFCVALVIPRVTAAQLRPLDPTDFQAFEGAAVHADLGVGYFADQHASLAGTQGPLWEIANFHVNIRSGRMLMEMGGTVQRLFHDEKILLPPTGDAAPPSASRNRHDAGDYRVGTVLRLTSPQSRTLATLRFGTRLPTTDNMVGLDRDATDFYTTAGARRVVGKVAFAGEAGLSINGTRKSTYEQSDVLIYALSAMLPGKTITPYVIALGQEDLKDRVAIRGNEDLGELRVGAYAGARRGVNVAAVIGYREYSPSFGVQLSGRLAFR